MVLSASASHTGTVSTGAGQPIGITINNSDRPLSAQLVRWPRNATSVAESTERRNDSEPSEKYQSSARERTAHDDHLVVRRRGGTNVSSGHSSALVTHCEQLTALSVERSSPRVVQSPRACASSGGHSRPCKHGLLDRVRITRTSGSPRHRVDGSFRYSIRQLGRLDSHADAVGRRCGYGDEASRLRTLVRAPQPRTDR